MSFLLHKLVKLFESCKQLFKTANEEDLVFRILTRQIFVAVEPSAWFRLVAFTARRINLRYITNMLLASFSRSVL